MMERHRGVATNSIILAVVQCLTVLTGMVQTMILSRSLEKSEYGTYSQGLLVVNFTAPLLLLGLSNAITYFSGQKQIDVRKYTSTLMTIIVMIGSLGVVGIIFFRNAIVNYFSNPALSKIILIVSIRPLLQNLIAAYQTLYIANDMSVTIAIRNIIVAIVQIILVCIGSIVFNNIYVIFLLLIVMDFVQVIVFAKIFQKKKYNIKLIKIEGEIVNKIFKYSIPLAISTMIGTISINMDKLLIGNMMGVEDFALYSNMAKELPFSFIVASFTTVITPVLIRFHANNEDDKLKEIWSKYLELGYLITWTLCGAAITCSKDLLIMLYSEKYIKGILVFITYLLVSCLRFSYFGIVLSAFGKTKLILVASGCSLLANLILNYTLFNVFGMIGPAIASFVVMLIMVIVQIFLSCRCIKCKVGQVLDFKKILFFLFELIVCGVLIAQVRNIFNIHIGVLSIILFGGLYVLIIAGINKNKIFQLIRDINKL